MWESYACLLVATAFMALDASGERDRDESCFFRFRDIASLRMV
jgi:hypothetical protein